MSDEFSPISTVTPATIPQAASGPSRVVKQAPYQTFNLTVNPNVSIQLFDDNEVGDLQGFEIATDSPDVNFQVIIYADNPTVPVFVNNATMQTLLQLGRGLTPGQVEILPNGESQDIHGTPSQIYPYLSRYKIDTIPDFTGSTQPTIVLKFEPAVYTSYKRIVVNIINSSLADPALIIAADIRRLVYVDLGPEEVPPDITTLGTSSFKRTATVPTPGIPTYKRTRKGKVSENDPLTYVDQTST